MIAFNTIANTRRYSIHHAAARHFAQRAVVATGLALASGAALAHPGHEAADPMLLTGLLHPLTGLDHLLAMLAVGLWAATGTADRRAALATPLSFLALMFLGALLGMAVESVLAVEPMIIASLLVFGLLLAGRIPAAARVAPVLAGGFALFHGIAHGHELMPGGSAAAYVVGFMLSSACLLMAGLTLGWRVRGGTPWLARLAGVGIAGYGVAVLSVVA